MLFYSNDVLVVTPKSARLQGGVVCLDEPIRLCEPPDQQGEYSEHLMLAMSHPERMVNGGLYSATDGEGTFIYVVAKIEGTLPGVWSRPGGWIAHGPSSVSTWS